MTGTQPARLLSSPGKTRYSASWTLLASNNSPALDPSAKREIHFWLASGDEIGGRLPGAAGQRPAQRAMAGVKVHITVPGTANQRYVAGRHGTQSRPLRGSGVVASARKKLLKPGHDRIAARNAQRG